MQKMLKSLSSLTQVPLDPPLLLNSNNMELKVRVVRDSDLRAPSTQDIYQLPSLDFDLPSLQVSLHSDPRDDFALEEIPASFNLSQSFSDYCDEKTTGIATAKWPSNPYPTIRFNGIEADPSQLVALDVIKCGRSLDIRRLSGNITFTLNVNQKIVETAEQYHRDVRCVFWDIRNGGWSTSGCHSEFDENTRQLKCFCNHLTSFTVGLMEAKEIDEQPGGPLIDGEDILGRLSIENFIFWGFLLLLLVLWLPWVVVGAKDHKDWTGPDKRLKDFFSDECLRPDIHDKCRILRPYRILVSFYKQISLLSI